MKPLRPDDLTNAVRIDGRGHRSAATLERIAERDRLLREAAGRFCIGMSGRQAAAMLHTKLARYRAGAWRREAAEAVPPPRHAGRLDTMCWRVLRLHDHAPSEATVRRALATFPEPPNVS